MNDLVAEAITEVFGERCPDFEPECHCCKAWAEFDRITALEAELQKVREALEPVARVAHAILSEAPANVDYYSVFLDCQGVSHRLKMDELRAVCSLSQDKEG